MLNRLGIIPEQTTIAHADSFALHVQDSAPVERGHAVIDRLPRVGDADIGVAPRQLIEQCAYPCFEIPA